MPILLPPPSNSLSLRFSSHPPLYSTFSFISFHNTPILPLRKPQSTTLVSPKNSPDWRATQISFCSPKEIFDDFSSTQLPETPKIDGFRDIAELELLGKPSPVSFDNGSVSEVDSELKKPDKDEALAPFMKFFKAGDASAEANPESPEDEISESGSTKMVSVEYYEPKPGDFVVGVVVSGNENKLDVNVGADLLGTMLTKEVLPLYEKELEYLLFDVERDAEEFMASGKMGIVRNDDALSGFSVLGRPVVEPGTVLFAEVLGRTLSGRPLLSSRRFFKRIAWHRVRQVLFLLFLLVKRPFGMFLLFV